MSNPYLAETLLIEGPDATTFAHAQFSSKVNALAIGQWQFSAWLDPQGRVRALFHLARLTEDRYLLLLRGGHAATMVDALRRFVLRAKLALTAQPVSSLSTGPALALHTIDNDGDALALGCDTYSMRIGMNEIADDTWHLPQLRAGWPWLPTPQLEQLLPAALSLQRLQAVAVDKGCYPGQEIIARLHFRGGHKRHLHNVILSHAETSGEALRHGERQIGCLLDIIMTEQQIEALAVLNDDVVADANDGRLNSINEQLVIRITRSWAE